MKKHVLLAFWFTSGVIALSSFSMDDDNGKAGHVGSPSEQTCSKSGCHTGFADNTGPGSVVISSANSDIMSGVYTPGQTYTLQVTVAQSGIGLFGFGLEALNTSNTNAGTLSGGIGSQIKQANVGGVNRKCVTHTLNGGSANNSKTWSFTWVAPTAVAATTVTLYAAGNATNEDGEDTGDRVYTTNMVLEPIVAIEEVTLNETSVSIYPNPSTDFLNISYALNLNATVYGRLYNTQGQLMKLLFAQKISAGIHTQQIDISDMAAGSYILQLDAGAQSIARTLQVQ